MQRTALFARCGSLLLAATMSGCHPEASHQADAPTPTPYPYYPNEYDGRSYPQGPVVSASTDSATAVQSGDRTLDAAGLQALARPPVWTKGSLALDTETKWLAYHAFLSLAGAEVDLKADPEGLVKLAVLRSQVAGFDASVLHATAQRYPVILGTVVPDAAGAAAAAQALVRSLERTPDVTDDGSAATTATATATTTTTTTATATATATATTTAAPAASPLPDDQVQAFAELDQRFDAAKADQAAMAAHVTAADGAAAATQQDFAAAEHARELAGEQAATAAQELVTTTQAPPGTGDQTDVMTLPRVTVYQGSNGVGWLATTRLGELAGFAAIGEAFTAFDCQGRQGDFAQAGIRTVFRSHAVGQGLVWDLAGIDEFEARLTREHWTVDGPAFCLALEPAPGLEGVEKWYSPVTAGEALVKEGGTPPGDASLGWTRLGVIGYAAW